MKNETSEKSKFYFGDNHHTRVYLYSVIEHLTKAKGIAEKMYKESVSDPVIVKALQWFLFSAMTSYFRFSSECPAHEQSENVSNEEVANVIDMIDEMLKLKK